MEPVPSSRPRAEPGLRRPAARGGYAPRGSCPASSGRQSASGRSGPVGRTVGGSGAGTDLGRLLGPLQGAAPWPGGSTPARVDPMSPRPPQNQSWERRQRLSSSPDSWARREAHGVGAGAQTCQYQGGKGGVAAPRKVLRENRLRATNRERAEGAKGNSRSASGSEVDDGVSGFLPRSARSLRITHAGGGGKRERGGKGAGRAGPPARGRSGPCAPCGLRSRPGPAQGGGAVCRGPGPRCLGRGSRPLPEKGREREAAG